MRVTPTGPAPEPDQDVPVEHLTAWHPCDTCGTRSFEVWRHPETWAILTFCAHHGREAQMRLHSLGYELYMTAVAYA